MSLPPEIGYTAHNLWLCEVPFGWEEAMAWRPVALGATFLFLVWSAAVPNAAADFIEEQELEFLREVLLRNEGRPRAPIVTRWRRSPNVGFFSFRPEEDRPLLDDVLTELNGVLSAGGLSFRLRFVAEPKSADILVVFVPEGGIARVMHMVQCARIFDEVVGRACVRGTAEGEYRSAVVAVLRTLHVDDRRSILLEELFQTLGPGNDSELMVDSITFEPAGGHTYATDWIKTLSDLDRRMLVFLYKHLEPGDDAEVLETKFRRHWKTLVLDPR